MIKINLLKIIGAAVLIVVAVFIFFYVQKFFNHKTPVSSEKPVTESIQKNLSTENSANKNPQNQAQTNFFNKYNLYYFDAAGSFTKNGVKIEKGGVNFTPDFLYSDGSFLSSDSGVLDKVGRQGLVEDVVNSSVSQNDYKLFFQGNTYDSNDYSESVLRDQNFIYYPKCLKVEYSSKSKGNRCVDIALYSNNDKIDEGGRPSDTYISTGISNIDLLFVKNGLLYYGKTNGERYDFYSYNPISKKIALYKPELFSNTDNELLGILDNGDIIFDNSSGIFKNNLQSKIIDSSQIEDSFLRGKAVGNNYYYFNTRYDQKNNDGGYDLLKDNLLISKIHSNVDGRIIDAGEQGCHLSNYIFGYLTLMYCIDKNGAVVRLDSKIKQNSNDLRGTFSQEDKDFVYFINNDIVDFSRYWAVGGADVKSVQSASFIFDEKGSVSYLVVEALDEKYVSNIYLVPYLGDGKIGEPQILVSNASLSGVIKN